MKQSALRRFAGMMMAVTLSLYLGPHGTAFAMESRSGSNLKGIDVSHWDGQMNWGSVASRHITFVYIKASGGDSMVDPRFAANVKGARQNGIAVGAYHYAKPTSPFNAKEPVHQADLFVHTMKSAMSDYGDIMPVLDVEESGGLSTADLVQWSRTFVNTVEQQTHRQVMLYTSEDFIERHPGMDGKLSDLPLWVAYYDRYYGGRNPADIAGWNHWTVWQYSDRGKISGIPAPVDLNAGPTSLAALKGDLSTTDVNSHPSAKMKYATYGDNSSRAESKDSASSVTSGSRWAVAAEGIVVIFLLAGIGVAVLRRARRKSAEGDRSVEESA